MENFLFKKSYQLNTFLSLPYKSLWGANGIFTTIRMYGKNPDLILLEEHLKKFNSSVKIFNLVVFNAGHTFAIAHNLGG